MRKAGSLWQLNQELWIGHARVDRHVMRREASRQQGPEWAKGTEHVHVLKIRGHAQKCGSFWETMWEQSEEDINKSSKLPWPRCCSQPWRREDRQASPPAWQHSGTLAKAREQRAEGQTIPPKNRVSWSIQETPRGINVALGGLP